MNGLMRCMICEKVSYVPPIAQHLRCLGCNAVYSIGTTDDSDTIHYKETTERWKKKAESKQICHRLWKRLPFSNDQPPRGSHNTNNKVFSKTITFINAVKASLARYENHGRLTNIFTSPGCFSSRFQEYS